MLSYHAFRDHKVSNCTSKISIFGVGSSVEAHAMLTPYAAKEQHGKRSKVEVVDGKITKASTTVTADTYMLMYFSSIDEIALHASAYLPIKMNINSHSLMKAQHTVDGI